MAFTGQLYKLVFGGQLGLNAPRVESWSCSIHVAAGADGVIAEGLVEGALEQWMARPTSSVNVEARLDYFKYNEVDPVTGRYVSQGTPLTHFIEPAIGGAGGGGPFQIAMVTSWVTASSRGLASKGRIFVPCGTSASAGTNQVSGGRFLAGVATAASVSAAQLITDLNGALGGSCVVFSAKGQLANEITAVRVGDVPDTQRRRRRSLPEAYSETAVS